jgi:tRNA(His) guanylyltransferase
MNNQLQDRMNRYEETTLFRLIPKQPVIIKVNARNISRLPVHDAVVLQAYTDTIISAVTDITTTEFVYLQQDECTLFLKDYNTKAQQQFCNGNIQNIISAVVSKFSYYFNNNFDNNTPVDFKAKCFNVPLHEVNNYYIWRQRDCRRNLINKIASAHFTQKELYQKNVEARLEMLKEAGHLGDAIPFFKFNGISFKKEQVQYNVSEIAEEQVEYFTKKLGVSFSNSYTRTQWVVDNAPDFLVDTNHIEDIVYAETHYMRGAPDDTIY